MKKHPLRLNTKLVLLAVVLCGTFLLALDNTPLDAADVDGTAPKVLTHIPPYTDAERDAGALLLLDGKTLFGWEAEPLKPTARADKPSPRVVMRDNTTRIETVIPMRIKTDLYLPRPWKLELTYHTEGETVAYMEIHDESNMFVKRFTKTLDETTEPKTIVAEAKGEQDEPIMFDGVATDQSGTVNGRTGVWIFVRSGVLVIDRLTFTPVSRSLFDGTLNGWSVLGDTSAEIEEADGQPVIHLHGGSGALESSDEYDDFYLSLDFKENASPNNSGLFFRTIPQSNMDGYEAQMNNLPPDEDREKFLGNDTGSIFRRAPARRLVSHYQEWNRLTVMAEGELFRTWVNGVPAMVWFDTRPADPNPRKGRRFKRGTIQIQGHDPATDLLLRRIEILDTRGWSLSQQQ